MAKLMNKTSEENEGFTCEHLEAFKKFANEIAGDEEKMNAWKNSTVSGQTGLRQDAFKDKEFQIKKHVNPEHYKQQCSFECIDTMIMVFGAKHTAEYCVTNAYKYVWRHKFKNELEDLKKAEWYLNKFDELVTYCETNFVLCKIEDRYLEIATKLRTLMEKGIEEYEKRN